MEIRNRETGAVTTVSQFKASYPNTSFPKQITDDILVSYGYDPVLERPPATLDAPYGVSTRDGAEHIDGQWFTRSIAGPVADSSADASAWATYRQALRDLPSANGWPHNISWPTKPS